MACSPIFYNNKMRVHFVWKCRNSPSGLIDNHILFKSRRFTQFYVALTFLYTLAIFAFMLLLLLSYASLIVVDFLFYFFPTAANSCLTHSLHLLITTTTIITTFTLFCIYCYYNCCCVVVVVVTICMGSKMLKHISETCQCVTFHIYLINLMQSFAPEFYFCYFSFCFAFILYIPFMLLAFMASNRHRHCMYMCTCIWLHMLFWYLYVWINFKCIKMPNGWLLENWQFDIFCCTHSHIAPLPLTTQRSIPESYHLALRTPYTCKGWGWKECIEQIAVGH